MSKQSVALCGAWAGTIAWSSSRQARYAGCLVWRRAFRQRWMGWMMLRSSWCFRAARRCIHGLCDGRLISFSQALKAKCWLGSMAFRRGAFGRAKGLGMQLSGSLRVDSGARRQQRLLRVDDVTRRQQRFCKLMTVPGKTVREAVEWKAPSRHAGSRIGRKTRTAPFPGPQTSKVVREGFEPPTRGFSVLCSTN